MISKYKKIISYCLVLALSLSFCGCGKKEEAKVKEVSDTIAPVFSNLDDINTNIGASVSYRNGVVAKDDVDGEVRFDIDASNVDINNPGTYVVIYTASDAAGNIAKAERTVTVMASVDIGDDIEKKDDTIPTDIETSEEEVMAMADEILLKITNDDMNMRQKAYAIQRYVHDNIKYIGSSDKSDWVKGAYVGFIYGRGDCYTYFACNKALLNCAGIESVDLTRIDGKTQHFWHLVNIDGAWYHFDSCWSPTGYPHPNYGFLFTERYARAYTDWVLEVDRPNYYTYDYSILDELGIVVADTPSDEDEIVAIVSDGAIVIVSKSAIEADIEIETEEIATPSDLEIYEPSDAVSEEVDISEDESDEEMSAETTEGLSEESNGNTSSYEGEGNN